MKRNHNVLIVIAVSFLFGIATFYSHCQTNIFYCKQLALILSITNLNQFKFGYITQSDSHDEIYIHFELKCSTYEDDIYDIITVRNTVTEYLKKHPNNKLNEKKIEIVFYEGPGAELFIIRNFNYLQPSESLSGLNYYYLFSIPNLSSINMLYNAEGISVCTECIDNTEFLKEMDSLRYLEIRTDKMTDDIKSDIINSFENCEVITDDKYSFELNVNE